MKRLALLGARGHGKVVADAALSSGWDSVEFFDDAWPQHSHNGLWPVTGGSAALIARLQEFQGVLSAIGNCPVRSHKHQVLMTAAHAFYLKTGAQPAGMLSAPMSAYFRAYLQAMEELA